MRLNGRKEQYTNNNECKILEVNRNKNYRKVKVK